MVDRDEQNLSCQLKYGNKSAFEKIYHLYKHPLFSYALRYLKDHELAEDALQDVFIKLWDNRQDLNEKLSIRAYLYKCLKNHVLNVIRTEQNRIKYAALAASEKKTVSNQTVEELSYRESKELLDQGINKLTDKRKKIFRLKIIEGYTNYEIADKLGLSEHTVRSQISQSSKYIREFFNKAITILLTLSCFC